MAVAIASMHILLLSQQPDLLLPHFTGTANDQLIELYTTAVLGPLDKVFGNHVLGTVITAAVWGLVGWVLYTTADFLVIRIKELRSSDKEVNVSIEHQVVYHPLYRQLAIRLLWRFLVGLIMVVATVLLQPIVATLFREDILFLRASSPLEMLRHAAISLGGWLILLHLYVILFRLFVLRTRVFGEIIY